LCAAVTAPRAAPARRGGATSESGKVLLYSPRRLQLLTLLGLDAAPSPLAGAQPVPVSAASREARTIVRCASDSASDSRKAINASGDAWAHTVSQTSGCTSGGEVRAMLCTLFALFTLISDAAAWGTTPGRNRAAQPKYMPTAAPEPAMSLVELVAILAQLSVALAALVLFFMWATEADDLSFGSRFFSGAQQQTEGDSPQSGASLRLTPMLMTLCESSDFDASRCVLAGAQLAVTPVSSVLRAFIAGSNRQHHHRHRQHHHCNQQHHHRHRQHHRHHRIAYGKCRGDRSKSCWR
jgi:hypothetical protein